ncbi:MAG: hypothetical protein V4495_04715 [Pseudomonadota bacterium]
MFEKILSKLWKKNIALSKKETNAGATGLSSQEQDSASFSPRWMDAADPKNPFGIPGCDCFAYTQSLRSTTTQENVESYFKLRGDFGERLIGLFPDNCISIPCLLEYTYAGEIADGALFKSQAMEEKWDIYLYESKIYFCRSWTGLLVYVAEIEFNDGKVRIQKIYAPREITEDDTEYAVRQVDYLQKDHLFKSVEPHPLPKNFPLDLDKIAAFSFSEYGSKCCFATYEDTINFQRPPRRDI